VQDIQNGHGICYLDPHGDAIRDIFKRIPDTRVSDVIYLNLEDDAFPFGLNLFDCPDPKNDKQVALTASFVFHVFEKVWGMGSQTPRLSQFMRNTSVTMISNPGMTFAEVPLLLTDQKVRNMLLANVTNEQVKLFWSQFDNAKPHEQGEKIESTYDRVDAFLTQPIIRNIIGQSKTTINLRKIMDERKILLVQLSPRFEDITSLVGAMLIGKLLDAAYSRADSSDRNYFGLYADEFQRFATSDFATILTEARKFGIATTIAHQVRDQLDEKSRGATLNAGNLVVFRVSGPDAGEMAVNFDSTPPPPIVIGQRPVLTPKRDVVEHLLKNGHSNPKHEWFIKWLVGLKEIAGLTFDRPQYRPQYEQPEQFIAVVRQMWANKQYRHEKELQEDAGIVLARLNFLFYEVMRDRDSAKPIPSADFITIAKVGQFYDLIKPEKRNQELIAMLCSPGEVFLEAIDMLPPRLYLQINRCEDFLLSIRLLMDILADDPIMADSGQHEPIYEKPRTYADVENQIATDIANLPPFTARVKLDGQECLLKTLPFSQGRSEKDLSGIIQQVQQKNRLDGYCREKSSVEAEIAKRQKALKEKQRIIDIDL